MGTASVNKRLTDLAAIVTGAGSGIGKAVARRLVEDGAAVLALDRNADDLHVVACELGCQTMVVDVTMESEVREAVSKAQGLYRRLDIVVNAAGVMEADDVASIDDRLWARMIDVNLTGAMRVCRAALEPMRRQQQGAIVNIASVAAFNASAGMASYAASKAGLVALTRGIANAYGAEGIRANCLCPGWVRTAMSEKEMLELASAKGTTVEIEFRALAARIALGRVAQPSEMAACAAFLASSDASFVTGAVLVADGGARTSAASRAH